MMGVVGADAEAPAAVEEEPLVEGPAVDEDDDALAFPFESPADGFTSFFTPDPDVGDPDRLCAGVVIGVFHALVMLPPFPFPSNKLGGIAIASFSCFIAPLPFIEPPPPYPPPPTKPPFSPLSPSALVYSAVEYAPCELSAPSVGAFALPLSPAAAFRALSDARYRPWLRCCCWW